MANVFSRKILQTMNLSPALMNYIFDDEKPLSIKEQSSLAVKRMFEAADAATRAKFQNDQNA